MSQPATIESAVQRAGVELTQAIKDKSVKNPKFWGKAVIEITIQDGIPKVVNQSLSSTTKL